MLLLGKPRPIVTKDEEDWIVAEKMRSPTSPRALGWQFVQEQSCNLNPSYKDAAKGFKSDSSALSAHRVKPASPACLPAPSTLSATKLSEDAEEAAELEEELTKPGAKPAKMKAKKPHKGKH